MSSSTTANNRMSTGAAASTAYSSSSSSSYHHKKKISTATSPLSLSPTLLTKNNNDNNSQQQQQLHFIPALIANNKNNNNNNNNSIASSPLSPLSSSNLSSNYPTIKYKPTSTTATTTSSTNNNNSRFQNISVRPLSPSIVIDTSTYDNDQQQQQHHQTTTTTTTATSRLLSGVPASATTKKSSSSSAATAVAAKNNKLLTTASSSSSSYTAAATEMNENQQKRQYLNSILKNNDDKLSAMMTNQHKLHLQQQQQQQKIQSQLLKSSSSSTTNHHHQQQQQQQQHQGTTTTTTTKPSTSIRLNNANLLSSSRCLSPVIHSSQMGTENLPSPRTLYIPATRRTETTTKHIIVSTETKRKKLTNETGAQTESRETHATQTTPDKEYEDIMLLKPIGRGLHNLEPDQQTFLRPTTPQAFARPFTPGFNGYATLDSTGNYGGYFGANVSRSRSMQGIAGYPTMLRSPSAPINDQSPYIRQPLGAILPTNSNEQQQQQQQDIAAVSTGGVNQRIVREHETEQTTTMHKEFRDGPYALKNGYDHDFQQQQMMIGDSQSPMMMMGGGPQVQTPGSTLPRSTLSQQQQHYGSETASSVGGDHQYSSVQRIHAGGATGATTTSSTAAIAIDNSGSLSRRDVAIASSSAAETGGHAGQTQTSSISINHPIHVDIYSGQTTTNGTSSSAVVASSAQQQQQQHYSTAATMTNGSSSVNVEQVATPSTPKFPTASSHKSSFSSSSQQQLQQQQQQGQVPPRFVNDTSRLWYRANISRDEAINLLKNKPAGTFLIRDSNTFKGAYGLAIKVSQLPANVQPKPGADPEAELVRHFLIERTAGGVRLKGCANEPVFPSLAALVYQHSITPLALPCLLVLPVEQQHNNGFDATVASVQHHHQDGDTSSQQNKSLLDVGAACNVVYLGTVDCESLSGPRALGLAVTQLLRQTQPESRSTQVHFKVNSSGITLTDNIRRLFFRRHYPPASVLFCGLDPEDRKFVSANKIGGSSSNSNDQIFGFVARRQPGAGTADNQCHVFAELDAGQPASAVVDFINSHLLLPLNN